MKSRDGKSQKEKETIRRKKIQVRQMLGKARSILFFPMICVSGGSKSRLAKAAGAEPSGQMILEKSHAVATRSACPTQNMQNTSCSDHFWKIR